jgi:hypothetical protein
VGGGGLNWGGGGGLNWGGGGVYCGGGGGGGVYWGGGGIRGRRHELRLGRSELLGSRRWL